MGDYRVVYEIADRIRVVRVNRVSGAHDDFPAFMVFVKGKKVYDFQQTRILALLPQWT